MSSMTDPKLFRLRVVFGKRGRLALLSHLEICRALERAVRRADLPFAVSQGFSPHMRIGFGAALPVGVGGTNEIFDLLMTQYVNPDAALEALRKASVPDLMCENCWYVEHTAKAASVAFPFSVYEAILFDAPGNVQVPDTVTVVRKKKEKLLRTDDFLLDGFKLEGNVLRFALEAKETGSLRPDVLLQQCNVRVKTITRVAQFDVAAKALEAL